MLGIVFSIYAGKVCAYIHEPIKKLSKPVKIVVPYKINPTTQRIYTPDQYHCFMRQTLKYCHDNLGRSLNGRIVNTDDQTVAYETYRNGYQSGETSVFDQQGILLSKENYKKGVRHGKAFYYYPNGNIEFVAKYDNGALNGRVDQYDINGGVIGKMNYKKGWFKDGYCKNESSHHNMDERLHHAQYNTIIPCGSPDGDE